MPYQRSYRGSSRASAPSRRRTGWEEGPGTLTATAFSSSSVAILGNGQEFLADGGTIVRIRGAIELVLSSVGSVLDGYDGAIGIGIVSTPAFAIGVTAMPTPITEIGWEGWMYHRFFSIHASDAALDIESLKIELDTKAMRKVNTEEVVFAAIEVVETGAAVMTVRLGSRMLLKLP